MNRRGLILTTTLSTILSIIFIIIGYYGLTRYVKLYRSTDRYVKNYANLPKADEKRRVVVSFSTTNKRMKKGKEPLRNSYCTRSITFI